MEARKKQNARPWTDHTGRELSDHELKQVSKSWAPVTWELYLSSLESAQKERQVAPAHYQRLANEQTETIFAQTGGPRAKRKRSCISAALADLTAGQREVIELIYLHSLSEREVARKIGLSRSTVSTLKERALRKMRFQLEEVSATLPLVRGMNDFTEEESHEGDVKANRALA